MNLSKCRVLLVDDTEENIDILVATLEDDYELSVAMSGKGALKVIAREQPDLILLDIVMPEMDGYEVCKQLKNNSETKGIPIIFLTSLGNVEDESKGLALGATDYITKPFNPEIVKARVKNNLILKMHQDNLEQLVKERTFEIEQTHDAMIISMGILAEYRDPETGGHIKRTQRYVRVLAEYLKKTGMYTDYLTDKRIEMLFKSAPLHDLGKIAVADSILLKPGKLTEEEFEKMKKHTLYGKESIAMTREYLSNQELLKCAEEIAYTHQEKWDGTGYPQGLQGEEIPLSGRLMAIADVYDALISRRVYKPPFSYIKAEEVIIEGRGKDFDPDLVDAFIVIKEEFRQIAIENADSDEEREVLMKKNDYTNES